MGDTALYGFQIAEVLDSLCLLSCALLVIIVIGLWARGPYFRKD